MNVEKNCMLSIFAKKLSYTFNYECAKAGDNTVQYYYGEQNIYRALDEAEFWKNQEAEHTTVIILTTPGLEQEYVDKLHQFELEFRRLHSELVLLIESVTRSKFALTRDLKAGMISLIKECIQSSQMFVIFLQELLQNSSAV